MKTATPQCEAFAVEVGLDLWALIDAVGVPVVEVRQVTSIPAAGGERGSFRVTFADGQILKARRLRTPADAERVARLSSLLDPQVFPPVLAQRGRGLLTRWIPGVDVRSADWAPCDLRTCGRVHATIHRLPVTADMARLRATPVRSEQRLGQLLDELVHRRALDACQADAVRTLTSLTAPPTERTAVCHRDFCGDNIVVTAGGQVCVVDNEGMTIDSPEYDLARTWYRWPMTADQQRAYAEGYGVHAHVAHFAARFVHWALIVLVESAIFRVRMGAASARVPLGRLTDLLDTDGRNESFPRLLHRD